MKFSLLSSLVAAAVSSSELRFKNNNEITSISFNAEGAKPELRIGGTATCTSFDGHTGCVNDRFATIEANIQNIQGVLTANGLTTSTNVVQLIQDNTNVIATNTLKVGITEQQTADIEANNAKIGVTETQRLAIIANTAKVGITTEQAQAILDAANRVHITTEQAAAIEANTARTTITTEQIQDIATNNAKIG